MANSSDNPLINQFGDLVDVLGSGLDKYSSFLETKNNIKAAKAVENSTPSQAPLGSTPATIATAKAWAINAAAVGAVILAGVLIYKMVK